MYIDIMRVFSVFTLFFLMSAFAFSQENFVSRGSVPEELLRPAKGEAPRYPVDIIIGELGRGSASAAAYFYANSVVTGLMSGLMGHPALSSIDSVIRESHLSAIKLVKPESFRIGAGRVEADGTASFLVRFIGKEQGIIGELYIRYHSRKIEGQETTTTGSWVFDELILEEARGLDVEFKEAINRLDFNPYERFY